MNEIQKVTVFIPAYNEEDSIGSVIDTVSELYSTSLTHSKGYELSLLVVNDGSTDLTEDIVKTKDVSVISHPWNLGLGAATRTGMTVAYESGADVAVKFDADLQHDPMDIEKVILPILEKKTIWGAPVAWFQ